MSDGPSLAGPRTPACACRDGASVAVRCFDGDGASPLVLDVHGGGYCYGHASADDRLCLDLRAEAGFLRFDGAEHGFVEIISDGRMKRGLARSARSCERRFAYYAEFLRAVAAFVGDAGTGKRENMGSEDKEEDAA